MKKSLFIILSLLVTSSAFAKLNVIVSIQPQLEFLSKIGGDNIEASLMVLAGSSPHTYEPKPSQMRDISKADLYLTIGVSFEKVWYPKFINQNKNLLVKNVSANISKIDMDGVEHQQSKHTHHNRDFDPHVWLSPTNVKQIAKNIYIALKESDANSSKEYKENLDKYLKELDELDSKIKEILSDTPKDSPFMVFHPSWGYFAKEYNLKQIAVEIDGKSPKPRELIAILKKAKKENIKVIFAQPEFSDKAVQTIAKELNIEVIKTSPLAKNWAENLIGLAKAIAKGKQ